MSRFTHESIYEIYNFQNQLGSWIYDSGNYEKCIDWINRLEGQIPPGMIYGLLIYDLRFQVYFILWGKKRPKVKTFGDIKIENFFKWKGVTKKQCGGKESYQYYQAS